jgi:hypothetical protein
MMEVLRTPAREALREAVVDDVIPGWYAFPFSDGERFWALYPGEVGWKTEAEVLYWAAHRDS